MLNTILIDAGPLIALFDRDDNYHERMKDFLRGTNYRFVSTLAVLTEVCYMLDFSIKAQMDFFEWVNRRGLILHDISQGDLLRVSALINQYHDLPMDFADATLVLAAEKRGIMSIVSIDSDFDIYRLPGKRMIKNVFRTA
ncbi:pilus biogenesis protein [Spirochaetia bacterium]|nr:pilus biogenesis protein [Spirochaetia bacterium]